MPKKQKPSDIILNLINDQRPEMSPALRKEMADAVTTFIATGNSSSFAGFQKPAINEALLIFRILGIKEVLADPYHWAIVIASTKIKLFGPGNCPEELLILQEAEKHGSKLSSSRKSIPLPQPAVRLRYGPPDSFFEKVPEKIKLSKAPGRRRPAHPTGGSG